MRIDGPDARGRAGVTPVTGDHAAGDCRPPRSTDDTPAHDHPQRSRPDPVGHVRVRGKELVGPEEQLLADDWSARFYDERPVPLQPYRPGSTTSGRDATLHEPIPGRCGARPA
jgi:hypothetical protein